MKFLFIFASFIFVANALDKEFVEGFVAKVKEIGVECVAEVSASADDVSSLLAHEVPESHEGKCLIFCFHKRFHIQHEDGSIDKEGALKAIGPLKYQDPEIFAKVLKVFQTCEDTPVDSDPCIYSANLVECAIKEGKAVGLEEIVVAEFE